MIETKTFYASVEGIGQVSVVLLPPNVAIPGQGVRVIAQSSESAADARRKLQDFLQELRDSANA